eukprot:TRINITY_DN918_c0_g1_i2.p1 TRINITY_DN918_c0_g1~~TRINITY_DN918_c0_g1_i2.p1  ORF type:complete len:425 (+),score=193.67 TRINITY_DN918_c0_g1_i2:33-1307(+)
MSYQQPNQPQQPQETNQYGISYVKRGQARAPGTVYVPEKRQSAIGGLVKSFIPKGKSKKKKSPKQQKNSSEKPLPSPQQQQQQQQNSFNKPLPSPQQQQNSFNKPLPSPQQQQQNSSYNPFNDPQNISMNKALPKPNAFSPYGAPPPISRNSKPVSNDNEGSFLFQSNNQQPPQQQMNSREQLFGGNNNTNVPPPVQRGNPNSTAYESRWDLMKNDERLKQQQYDSLKLDTTSTRLAIQKAREAQEIGSDTLVQLGQQADRINKIEGTIQAVHVNLDQSQSMMNQARGLHGRAFDMVRLSDAEKNNKKAWSKAHADNHVISIQDHSNGIGTNAAHGQGGNQNFYNYDNQILSNNAPTTLKEQLNQQEQELAELNLLMGNLQNIAGTMGNELDRQNYQLDELNRKAYKAVSRTQNANYNMENMMN